VPRVTLGPQAIKTIKNAVSALFARAKARFLGIPVRHEIKISVHSKPLVTRSDLSLPGLFDAAATAEGFRPAPNVRNAVIDVATAYMDAHEKLAQAQVVHAVQSWLTEAETKGVKTDMDTVLGGELADLMGRVTTNVKRVVETESTKARNAGALDAITKIAAATQVSDPHVFFAGPNDQHTCEECQRLFFMPDGVTPRVYLLSEVGHGYHRHGDPDPKIGGAHPNCRHSIVYISKGYGFRDGKITYLSPNHVELEKQRENVSP
jgi:uncharacterized protein YqgV (UPF0045/DUF77 family)